MMALIGILVSVFLMLVSDFSIASSLVGALCRDKEHFNCYTVKRSDSWKTLFSNPEQRDLVMRLNRINTSLYRGMEIAVPKNLDTAVSMDFAPLPKTISPPGEKIIYVSIDPAILAWGAYNAQGVLLAWGPVSAARGWCPDIGHGCHTVIGKFAIYQKEGAGCVSRKFPVGRGGAPMPYCMFFHGGFALHGSYEVPGYNASHGCVRMFVPDAKWLNQEFVGDENVQVIVSNHT